MLQRPERVCAAYNNSVLNSSGQSFQSQHPPYATGKVMWFNINSNHNIITFFWHVFPSRNVFSVRLRWCESSVVNLVMNSNKWAPAPAINSHFLPPIPWLFLVKRLFLAIIQCYTKWLLQPIVFSFRGCPTVSTSLATTQVNRYCFAMQLLFYNSLFKRTLQTILHDLFAIIRSFYLRLLFTYVDRPSTCKIIQISIYSVRRLV